MTPGSDVGEPDASVLDDQEPSGSGVGDTQGMYIQ